MQRNWVKGTVFLQIIPYKWVCNNLKIKKKNFINGGNAVLTWCALSISGWHWSECYSKAASCHMNHCVWWVRKPGSDNTKRWGANLPWSFGLEQWRDYVCYIPKGFPGGSVGKKIHLQCRKCRFNPWVGKIPWRRAWLPNLVFWPGESHGKRSLVGYST